MKENEISEKVIGAAIEVHKTLGPGLLESIYQDCLEIEFRMQELEYQREKAVPLNYKGSTLSAPLKIDFLVGDAVIVETKSVRFLLPVHNAQLLTYLRLTGHKLGLLLNFNVATMTRGIKRLANNL